MNPTTAPCPRCGRPLPSVPQPTQVSCRPSRGVPEGCRKTWYAETPEALLQLVRREPHGLEFIAAVRVLKPVP